MMTTMTASQTISIRIQTTTTTMASTTLKTTTTMVTESMTVRKPKMAMIPPTSMTMTTMESTTQ
jgi:hypothetical protein